jgi:molybdopterin-guanine dinucleotide biosynthesis protein A
MAPVQASRWAGALIAGGKSSRMGQDKLALRLHDGRRVLEIPAQALRDCCGHCLLVAPDPQPQHALHGFQPLADALPDGGPLAGLVAALEWASTQPEIKWVMALAGDLPFMQASVVQQIQVTARTHPGLAVVAMGDCGPEPLIAAYPVAFAIPARQMLDQGKRALQGLLDLQPWMPCATPEVLGNDTISPYFNLNLPQDWEYFLDQANATEAP